MFTPALRVRGRRLTAALSTFLLTTSLASAVTLTTGATTAAADTAPVSGEPATVSADALPTVQIDGVAWDQVAVGNTVYVTGSFSYARPAGTAATSSSRVARTNLLAYDITTGALITSFNHTLNAQGRRIVASPDGKRVYVVGNFTSVDGQTRNRIAAFDTATGALVSGFAPSLNSTTLAVAATNDTVYFGGNFTTVNGVARARLAAVSSTGTLLNWNPGANAAVLSLLVAPNNIVVVGGAFSTLAGAARSGFGSVNAGTGAAGTWATNFPFTAAGDGSGVNSLTTNGSGTVFGTVYSFSGAGGGNFVGRFAVNPANGAIVWMNPCHGDSYDSWAVGDVIYSASHEHDCSDIGSFSQDLTDLFASTHHFAEAETAAATGKNRTTIFTGGPGQPGPRYTSFAGQPSSTQLNWYPTFKAGSYTGQYQAAWSITGNSSYLSVGGEFPSVNGTAQQGLVRFAIRTIAPNKIGPTAVTAPTAISLTSGTLQVSWRAAYDLDNSTLTYRLYRDAGTTPIYTTSYTGTFARRPALSFNDTGLAAGSSHTYKVSVTDPLGNAVTSAVSGAATVSTTAQSSYPALVAADGASNLWRFSQASGTNAYDSIGGTHLTLRSGVSLGAAGPITGDNGTAATFSGTVISTESPSPFPGGQPRVIQTSNSVASATSDAVPLSTFTVEAWVKTTSTSGGLIVGDGLFAATDGQYSPNNVDRLLYFNNDGKVYFGVYSNYANQTIGSSAAYNDGQWHHIAGTIGAGGGRLYVDGTQVAANAALTSDSVVYGHWRVGGEGLLGWTPQPTSNSLAATIADVAVYPTALSAGTLAAHFAAAGQTGGNAAPTAAFTATCTGATCTFSNGSSDTDGTIAGTAWTFGDTGTSTAASPSHTYTASGTYPVTLTVTDNDGGTDTVSHSVTVTVPAGNAAPTASFTSSCTALSCSFTSTSTDTDGSIAGYAWNFGDNSTATTANPTHPYAAAGSYTVTLTVTDDDGATASTTGTVSPTAAQGNTAFASDSFGRTTANGWGTAGTGGAWTVSTASRFSVGAGAGSIALATAGASYNAYLGATSSTSADVTLTTALDKVPAGTAYLEVVGRRAGSNREYTGLVKITAAGAVQVGIRKLDGTTTAVDLAAATTVAGLTYTPGTQLNVRFQATGASPTTLRMKVWVVGTPEPAAWTKTVTDSSAALQVAGAVGVRSYISSGTTNVPLIQTVRNFSASPVA